MRRKIFVVDDDTANLTTCKAILRDDYDVFTATSAASMFSLLKNVIPDIILLDVRMTETDGYEAARMLKKNDEYKEIPVIFVSALNDVESEMEGLELGAIDYISKPYFPPILIQRIETHLDLIDKTKMLEEASNAKTNFLANMSHEMRTPLTAVLGLTELVLNTAQLESEIYSNLIKAYRAGETLLALVNDLLDVSKIEADKFTINPAEYNVLNMLEDAITQSIVYAETPHIKFSLNVADNIYSTLYGDELRVRQILTDLLTNAFKYTHIGTVTLTVTCTRCEDKTRVKMTMKVEDTGIGIHAEDIDKLFTVYSRLEKDTHATNRFKGTGLGLFIVKNIAEMMDGTVTVESEYGKGSCFTVQFMQGYVDDKTISSNEIENLKKMQFQTNRFNKVKKFGHISDIHILIVDDTPINLEVLKGMLAYSGAVVDCANSGQQAIDAVTKKNPKYDIIFMDYLMPGKDGIETVRTIRNNIGTEYATKVPIVALTADAVECTEEMFLDNGFDAYLTKPVSLSEIEEVIKKFT